MPLGEHSPMAYRPPSNLLQMAIALELSARMAEILNAREAPVLVIDKLREIKVVEVADFATIDSNPTVRMHRNGIGRAPPRFRGILPALEVGRVKPGGFHDTFLTRRLKRPCR